MALDGLRGVAAIIVMFFHRRYWSPDGLPLEHAGLAVDFFFMLSGFVISLAYEKKILNGMGFMHFAAIRLARLGPLLLLGALLGISYFSVLAFKHKYHFGPSEGLAMMLSLIALPTPFPAAFFPDIAFPVNGPSWSLFFELVANAVFALFLLRLRGLMLAVLIIASFAGLVYAVTLYGTIQNFGNAYGQTLLGLPRVLFPFLLGVVLCRWCSRFKRPPVSGGFWVAAVLLVGCFMLDVPREFLRWYELFCIAVVCPLVIVVGANASLSVRGGQWAAWFGKMSYPVYILHIPLLNWFEGITGVHSLYSLLLAGILIIIASQFAITCWDDPMRRRLDSFIKARWSNVP